MAKKKTEPVTKGVAKVPVVMQMEALECGSSCLCMVMAYYGKWIPPEQARNDCGVSRDGSNANNILRAARSYGFNAVAYTVEPEVLREEGAFPCIVHWEFSHFVVVKGFKGDKVYLNDPASGPITVTFEQFDEAFTGVCLLMEPGDHFEPSGKKKTVWSFASKRLKRVKAVLWFMIATMLITSLTGILNAAFSRIFLDELLPGDEPQILRPFLVGLSVLALIQISAAWIQAIYSLRIKEKMDVAGSSSYMWKVFRLPMEFFSQRMTGDIQQRKDTNAQIAGQLVGIFAPLLIDTIMMFFYLVVMLRYSLLLTLIGVISILIQYVFSRIIAKKRVQITRVMMRDQGKIAGYTVSGFEMIENIKASGAENGFFERWSGYQASINTQNIQFGKIRYYIGLIPDIVASIMNILVMTIGVWLVMRGEFTPGMILAFQGFLSSFLAPAASLIGSGQQMQEMRTNMERIEDVMEYPEDVNYIRENGTDEHDLSYSKLSGNLVMRNVTFGYSRMDAPLISNFNLNLEAGKCVAFVGSSGCGKTTISRLIANLYQPWSGQILFDGRSASQIDHTVFTGSVAVVDQEITFFEDTVTDNIKMWNPSIEDAKVIQAARDAQIHSVIMQRDGGYLHTMLEGGKDFSGGERQRIEIARALSMDPAIIIMDEATSGLDAHTEYEVIRSIRNRGITCIVIAHRISTIRDCDEIIVLDHGNIAEQGTHEELLAKQGRYAQLVSSD